MLLLILAMLMLAAAVFLVGEAVTIPSRERQTSVRRAAGYGLRRTAPSEQREESLKERALLPLKEQIARTVLRLNPKITVESISLRLLSAGVGRRISPTGFLAAKGLLALGGLPVGAALGASIGGPAGAVMLALVFGGCGFILPDFVLGARAKSRREVIRSQLPDALDLLAVSVEAGLGFDGALAKLTEHMEGPLTEEFALVLSEMRIGESRQEALKKLSERVDAPELHSFTRAIIQADQFGISLGRILKVQAADTRLKRQAAAEEKAMKAPIKMLFPTVAFIFPAMFLVILGPAFLNLTKIL